MRFGIGEIFIVLLIMVLVFGASRIPELAKSLGQSIKEFKNSTKEQKDEVVFEDDKLS